MTTTLLVIGGCVLALLLGLALVRELAEEGEKQQDAERRAILEELARRQDLE